MKKFFSLFVLFLMVFTLVSCGGSSYEIAMITDTGDIDDGSFNQGTWEGIKAYAEEHKVSHKYFKPGGETTDDYEAAIDLAVSSGAKIVITPGFYFEVPIYNAQTKYPDVKFVILDGSPHNGEEFGSANHKAEVADNTLAIFFQEEQAGFLAGYAAVKEGLRKLGYMGGVAVPAVQRFGIGWVAGAYQAAQELELSEFSFSAENYMYLNSFSPSDEFKNTASAWYTGGVEGIHVAAGGAGSSIMAAAEDSTDKWVIGVDSDQSGDSKTVLTSAVKGVASAAYQALESLYGDKFPGGETWNLGAKEAAVSLPMDTSRFENFKEADYTTLFNKVKDGSYAIPTTADALETFVNGLALFAEVDLTALKAKI